MKRNWPVIVMVVILLIWFVYPPLVELLRHWGLLRNDLQYEAQHGDAYGGLNALFSGFAFVLLIYTVRLQSEELALQRQELSLTRDELKRTAIANEEAAKAMAKQVESQLLAALITGEGSLLASYEEEISFGRNRGHTMSTGKIDSSRTTLTRLLEEARRRIGQ